MSAGLLIQRSVLEISPRIKCNKRVDRHLEADFQAGNRKEKSTEMVMERSQVLTEEVCVGHQRMCKINNAVGRVSS